MKKNIYTLMAAVLLISTTGLKAQVSEVATKDNCIYNNRTSNSNGGGSAYTAGAVATTGYIRRVLVAFEDLTDLVDPSEIDTADVYKVELKMWYVQGSGGTTGARPLYLHKATADWGENTSTIASSPGVGTAAGTGDATWLKSFYNTVSWTTAGGDFISTASASITIPANTAGSVITFTGTASSNAQMLSDVRKWIMNDNQNFGWIILGDETGATNTAAMLSSKDQEIYQKPTLYIYY
jgi:hypothetical protein